MNAKSCPCLIPAGFFLLACITNLVARATANTAVAAMVKPALMPLVALTLVAAAGSMESKTIRLGVLALLLGCAGDIFLIADGLPAFGCGLGCFLLGHIVYFMVFGSRSWKGIKPLVWAGVLAVMAAVVAGLLAVIGVKGGLLAPIFVYSMALMLLIWCGLAGVIRLKGATWWIVLFGGLLFTFSDSLIAIQMFGEKSALLEFLVMLTYMAAQCLLAWGALRLSREG